MIALVEGAERQKTPNESLNDVVASFTRVAGAPGRVVTHQRINGGSLA